MAWRSSPSSVIGSSTVARFPARLAISATQIASARDGRRPIERVLGRWVLEPFADRVPVVWKSGAKGADRRALSPDVLSSIVVVPVVASVAVPIRDAKPADFQQGAGTHAAVLDVDVGFLARSREDEAGRLRRRVP